MESYNESDFYTEEEFAFDEFEKKLPNERKRLVLIGISSATAAAILFFALTSMGRAWAANSAGIIIRSFENAIGMKGSATTKEMTINDGSSTEEDGLGFSGNGIAFAADATSSVEATSEFPEALPVGVTKKSAKPKTTKKAVTKKATPTASAVNDATWGDDAGDVSLEDAKAAIKASNAKISNAKSSSVATISNIAPAAMRSSSEYALTIAITGNGRGFVSSTPKGIECDGTGTCSWNFEAGEKVTLQAAHDTASMFSGWSGACTGNAMTCTFTLNSAATVTANFKPKTGDIAVGGVSIVPTPVMPAIPTQATDTTVVLTSSEISNTPPANSAPPATQGVNHVVISSVQIAGDAASNDFVTLWNPTSASIDMSGWKLHKKSSTGSDASLKVFPASSVIAPGGDFIWANSTDGFSDTIRADVASTQTLAANNSVGLFDASGTLIDAVAWGTGSTQYVEDMNYPDNPLANQVLTRKSANGMVVDTDNNMNDFEMQTMH